MKTLEQLAKEAGFDIADDGFVRAEGRILNARLSGFRALCMEEAAQIVANEFVGESLDDKNLCDSDVAYNMALRHALDAIRASIKA